MDKKQSNDHVAKSNEPVFCGSCGVEVANGVLQCEDCSVKAMERLEMQDRKKHVAFPSQDNGKNN